MLSPHAWEQENPCVESTQGLSSPARVGQRKTPRDAGRTDHFGIMHGISRMNVTFNDVVVHEPINDIGGFALGGAGDVMIPKEVALIDEGVDRTSKVTLCLRAVMSTISDVVD